MPSRASDATRVAKELRDASVRSETLTARPVATDFEGKRPTEEGARQPLQREEQQRERVAAKHTGTVFEARPSEAKRERQPKPQVPVHQDMGHLESRTSQGPKAPLDIYAITVQQPSVDELMHRLRRQVHRQEMGALRAHVRRISSNERVRKCGVVNRRAEGPGLAVNVNDPLRVAGWRGLVSCMSATACPRCAAVVAHVRAQELQQGLDAWSAREGEAVFLTLTLGHWHRKALTAKEMLSMVMRNWGKLQRRKAWLTMRQGMVGSVRAVEATYSEKHGWHVHLHVVLFTMDAAETMSHRQAVMNDWIDLADKAGYHAVEQAQDMRPVQMSELSSETLGGYLVKQGRSTNWTIADEVTRWSAKTSRGESVTPLEILAASMSGEQDLIDLWHQWEAATRSRRMFEWSKGLKELLGIEDISDEEIVGRVDDGAEDREVDIDQGTVEIAGIPGESFGAVARQWRDMQQVLNVAENSPVGMAAVESALIAHVIKTGFPLMVGDEWRERHGSAELAREQDAREAIMRKALLHLARPRVAGTRRENGSSNY